MKHAKKHADDLIEMLATAIEAQSAPWQKPCKCDARLPTNLITGKVYTGRNLLMLATVRALKAYDDHRWAGFQQIKSAGGHVRRGERGHWICIIAAWAQREQRGRTTSTSTRRATARCPGPGGGGRRAGTRTRRSDRYGTRPSARTSHRSRRPRPPMKASAGASWPARRTSPGRRRGSTSGGATTRATAAGATRSCSRDASSSTSRWGSTRPRCTSWRTPPATRAGSTPASTRTGSAPRSTSARNSWPRCRRSWRARTPTSGTAREYSLLGIDHAHDSKTVRSLALPIYI